MNEVVAGFIARKPFSERFKAKSPELYCSYCKRRGHEYSTCRRRLNQCLRCGSDDHFISNCPLPRVTNFRARSLSISRRKHSSLDSGELNSVRSRSRTRRHRSRTFRRGVETQTTPLNGQPLV